MFNSGKHFLTGLLNHLGRGEQQVHSGRKQHRLFHRNVVSEHLKPRSLQMETLEDRQLLAVTAGEKSQIAVDYASFGVSANDNFIEITNENLTAQQLVNAISQAANTSANDVIVLRTSAEHFTIDLGSNTLNIDVNSAAFGSITIIGRGVAPLRLTSNNELAIYLRSGDLNLGYMEVVGTKAGTSNTPIDVVKSATGTTLQEQNVTLTTRSTWTVNIPNRGTAYYSLINGIYTVDFPTTVPGDATTTYRSYISGLTSVAQVNYVLNNVYLTGTNSAGDTLNYYQHKDFIDANISKTSNYDSNHSWAGAAADMLAYTGWGNKVSTNPDDLLRYFSQNFNNNKYYVEGGLEWFMNGTTHAYQPTHSAVLDDEGKVVTPASNDVWATVTGTGGNIYGPNYPFQRYGGTFYSGNYYNSMRSASPMVAVSEMLDAGYAVATNLNSWIETSIKAESYVYVNGTLTSVTETENNTTHDYRYATSAMMIYGYVYDTSKTLGALDYYTHVYAADPTDGSGMVGEIGKLQLYAMTWKTDGGGNMINSYQLVAGGHSITSEQKWVYGTPTSSGSPPVITQTDVATTTRVETVSRMGSFVYLAMAPGQGTVEQDPYEPNESANQVDTYPVSKPTALTPNLGIIDGKTTIEHLNLADTDGEDWFKFQTVFPCSISDTISIEYYQTLFSGGVKFYLYARDNNGKLVLLEDYNFQKALVGTDPEGVDDLYRLTMSLGGLVPGTYYLRIYRDNPGIDCKDYTLTFTTNSDDRYEVNNTRQDVDKAPVGGGDSPNFGPVMVSEMVVSDLVLRQASPSAIQTSEVDAFCFIMTGYGGINSYIEIQYLDTNPNSLSPYDAELDLFLYRREADSYYAQYPTAWASASNTKTGTTVKDDLGKTIPGVKRISLDGLGPGTYYIKIAGFINSENLLHYKLIIHLRDETDPPGIGVTALPDYYVSTPGDWRTPLVVTKEQWELWDPENSRDKLFSTGGSFYTQDKIYVNYTFSASENAPVGQTVRVGLTINGWLVNVDLEYDISAGGTIQITDQLLAELTNEVLLTINGGNFYLRSDGSAWSNILEDGMVISVLNDHNFIETGYVYNNGKFIAITPTTDLVKSGDLLLFEDSTGAYSRQARYYKQTVMLGTKTYTEVFVNSAASGEIRYSTANVNSMTAIPVTLLTATGALELVYNANTNRFTLNGGNYAVPVGSILTIPEPVKGSTVKVQARYTGSNLFQRAYFDIDAFGLEDVSKDEYVVSPSKPLVATDGSTYYYRAFGSGDTEFYRIASATTDYAVGDVFTLADGIKVTYRGVYSGTASDPNGLYQRTLVGQGMFLTEYTAYSGGILYYGGTADSNRVYLNSVDGKFYRWGTTNIVNVPANSVLKTSANSDNNINVLFQSGKLWISYEQAIAVTDDSPLEENSFLVTTSQHKNLVVTYAGNGVFFDANNPTIPVSFTGTATLFDYTNGCYYSFNSATGFTQLINTIPNGEITRTINSKVFQYEDSHLYATVGKFTDGTRFTYDSGTYAEKTLEYKGSEFYQVTTPVTTFTYLADGGARYLMTWDNGAFFDCKTANATGEQGFNFADDTRFIFYQGTVQTPGTSYIKVTPASATHAQAAYYTNTASFEIDPYNEIPEYLKTNNSFEVSFAMARYQDDQFVPNATKLSLETTPNTDQYQPGVVHDPNAKYDPNLGPISGNFVIDNLALMTPADWFSFEVLNKTTGGDYSVKIDFDSKMGDLDLYIYKADTDYPGGYRLFGYSAGIGNSEFVSLASGGIGLYYIQVIGYRGDTNPYYKLTIDAPPPADPTNIKLNTEANVINSSALISWSKPGAASNYVFGGADEFFLYTEVVVKDDTGKVVSQGQAKRGVTNWTVTGLIPGSDYTYTVTAYNSIGQHTITADGVFSTGDFLADTKYYGLIIGVDGYANHPTYRAAKTDAVGVYNALVQAPPQWWVNTATDTNITLLTGNVTKQAIADALYEISLKAQSNDVVFIYYAGLGTTKEVAGETTSYLTTYNSTISDDELATMIGILDVGQVQLVLNPYFTNSSISNPVIYDYVGFGNKLVEQYQGTQTQVSVITSARNGENTLLDAKGNDIFGQALISALSLKVKVNGEDYYVADLQGNRDHRLSFEEIYNYVRNEITQQSSYLQTPQLIPTGGADSIVIKGNWKEIDTATGYNYFNDLWWNANAIVVTTKADVVDATDGIISLREAISWLGTTLNRDTRLIDGTDYRDAGGVLRSFNYQSSLLNPNDKFTINNVEYTYRQGLYYTASGQNVLVKDGSSFLYQGNSYTYVNNKGKIRIDNSDGNDVTNTIFANSTSTVTVVIGGSTVTLRQTGVAIESRVMSTITFGDSLIGSNFALREELVIDSTKFYNATAITSVVIDASILAGSSTFYAATGQRHLSVKSNVTQSVAMVGFIFVGGSSDDGAAIKNEGDLWLLNTLIYGNEAGNAGTIANYGTLSVVNSTIAGNYLSPTATGYAGIVNQAGATLNVVNSILYGNERGDLDNTAGGTVSVNYSLVSVGHNWTIGTKNIDPSTTSLLFRDADNYDFHIVQGSPVINAADPAQAQRPDGKRLDYDLDGNSRMLYGGVDMGAYEWVDPTLKLSTTITTIGEDNVINDRISLREAISYVGTTYTTEDRLVDVEGTDFRLNGSIVYAEEGQFYTHQSGYYFTLLTTGAKVQLVAGDLITDYTAGITYRFTGSGFVNHSTGAAIAAPSQANELVLSRTGQNAVTGHYSNYISVLFTGYQSGDTITYRSDNSTGIVRKNADGSITIRKTVTLSNNIQFNIDAIKADFLKTRTIFEWDFMIANYGLVFALETGNYPGAISIYSSLNINVTAVNVIGGTTAEKVAILTKGITIVPNTGSTDRVFNVKAAATDNVSLQNVRLAGNGQTVVGDGGAIYLYSGNLTLNAVTIAGFKATGAGGAIYVAAGATLNVTNQTKIIGNVSAQNGGAIYVAGQMTMSGSEITGNAAGVSGGAIYVDSLGGFTGNVTLTGNNVISGNQALFNGGAIYNAGTFVINGSATSYTTISGNTAGVSGGGVYNSGSFTATRLVTYTGTVGNTTTAGSGGFAFNTLTGSMTFNYSKICYNNAFGNGGGIANYGGLLLYASDVSGNTGMSVGAKGAGIYDGALSVSTNGYSTSIINSVISGNGSLNVVGGAIFAENGASIYLLYSTVIGNLSNNATYNGIVLGSNTSLYLQSSVVALHQTTSDSWSQGNDIAINAGATNVSITSRYSFVGLTPSTVGWMIAGDISLINPTDRNPGFTRCTIDNLVNDYLNWATWDLVPGLNSQLIGKAELVLTYQSLAGGTITIVYDKTGHRSRVLPKDGAPDVGAYEAGIQTEDKSLVVTTWLDVVDPSDNVTSLREAIYYATDLYLNDGMMMTITFDADIFSIARTIELTWRGESNKESGSFVFGEGAVFVIDASSVNIAGQEPTITISGRNEITPIIVHDGANVEIRGVIIADGYAQESENIYTARGGAVRLFGGTFLLTNSIIRNNDADDVGGAFYQMAGNLILTQCLVYNSKACLSIIPGSLDRGGGAIRSIGGRLTILSSTISRNQAPLYGGVYATDTVVSIYNSILAENTDGIGFNVDLYTRNLFDIYSCFVGQMYNGQVINRVNGNIVGTTADPKDPKFVNSAAGDFRLKPDSPAINTGNRSYAKYPDGAQIVTDIAGNTRQTQIDIGVYESDRIDPSSTIVTTLLDVVADDGLISIREAIANAKTLGTPITFDIRAEERTGEMRINLDQTLGALTIDFNLTINATNIPGGVIIDAKGGSGVIKIEGNANVNLTSIVLTGGVALGGAAISVDSVAEGTISLTNCVIVNNSSNGYGGAIYLGSALSKLKLLNCTVAGNVSNDYGAIYGVAGAQMTIQNSIIADNLNNVGGATTNYDIHSGSTNANSLTIVTSLIGSLDPAWVTRGSVIASIYGTTTQSASPSFTVAPQFSSGRVINADQILLTLRQRSQAINTGNNTFVGMPGYLSNLPAGYRDDSNAVIPYDLAGNDRITYYIVDMGAYEYNIDTPIKEPAIVVTTLDDTVDPFGTGISLREAIIYAGTSFIRSDGTSITLGTEITFDRSLAGGTITLSETFGTLNINKSVSISATGLSGGITINAGGKFRAITVGGGDIDVVLEYFTITGGNAGTEGGGGIYHVSGNLTVVNSLIYNNNAARGGAIYSIADPRFSAATISLVNCTITKNNAYSESNDIISGYGGVYALRSTVRFYNTLVALNTTGYNFSNPPVNCPYTYTALAANGYFLVDNLVGNATYESSLIGVMATWLSIDGDSRGNIAGTALNPLNPHFINWDSNNFNLGKYASGTDGSITLNSPAINAGQNAFAVDHLGNPLSYDLNGAIRFVEKVDIGAFESYNGSTEIPSIIVTTLNDVVDPYDGHISLREALFYAGTNGLGTTITFMKALSGGILYLDKALNIDKNITIDGASLGTNITLSTKMNVTTLTERVLYINSGSVTLINLTITNYITERLKQGQTINIAQGGAIYQLAGSLTLYNCVIADNMASVDNIAGSGGAIFVADGATTITNIVNCTITNNRAGDAAIIAGSGRVNIKNSVLARNRIGVDNTDIIGSNIVPENSFIQYTPSPTLYGTGEQGNYIGKTPTFLKNEAENYLFVDWANGNYRLKDTSLAINSGENVYSLRNNNGQIIFNGMINFSEVDSLGKKRLVGQTIDMGAFENQTATDNYNWVDAGLITVTTNRDTSNAGDGLISLREAVARAERLYDLGIEKPVTFSQYYLGLNPRMVLGDQAIIISRPITIDANYEGNGLGEKLRVVSFHIDGANLNNIFRVQVDVTKLQSSLTQDVKIYNFELSNGLSSGGGAIYHASGNLVLLNVLIHSSVAKFDQSSSKSYGGAIYSAGNLTLVNCTIANNTADFGAGIYMARGSNLTMYNTIVAKNILNGATTMSDVDLAFELLPAPAQITSLEIRNSLIGRAYSLRALNDVNSNMVGYGSDSAVVDPYFISIGRNNYRLQPRVNGEVNPARELGSYDFALQNNLRYDLDGNDFEPLQTPSDAQAELNYFNNYVASLGSNPTVLWTNGLLTKLNNDIAQGRRGDLVTYHCQKYLYKGGDPNSTDDFLVYYADEIQLADDTIELYNTYREDNAGSDNLYMFRMWLQSEINWDDPDPKHMLLLELLEYPGQFGRLYADLKMTTLTQLGVALAQYRDDCVTSQNIAFPGGNPLAPTFFGIYNIANGWGTTGNTAKNLKKRIEGKFSKLVISNVVQVELVRADIDADIAGKISIGAYQPTREVASTIVTTLEDIVDAYDGVISLREAIVHAGTYSDYYAGNNRYYSYDPLTGYWMPVGYSGVGGVYNTSVSLSEFYSTAPLLINRSPITFASHLAGGTIVLESPLVLANYNLNLVRFYYIDASSLAAGGGITIDASNCDYAFQLEGAVHPSEDWVAVSYTEFEGLTITGARIAGIEVDPYSVAEIRNCLIYRNGTGVIVRDGSLPEVFKYYGVAHIYNTTIANNYGGGIDNFGQVNLYNSVVSLNTWRGVGGGYGGGDDLILRSHDSAGYRLYNVAYSLVGTNDIYSQDGSGHNYYNLLEGVIRLSDALFVDEANDDYHLAAFSWGINTGSASYLAKNRPTHADAQTDMEGGARTQCGLVDIGCYENPEIWKVPSTTVTTNIDRIDMTNASTRNEVSLREAIKYAEQFQYLYEMSTVPNARRIVTFDPTMAGKTINLTGGAITLVNDIAIVGFATAAQRVTINAMGQSGVFRIDSANTKYLNTIFDSKINITLSGMNLTGGYATDGGAIYIASGNVLVQDSDIYGNRATGHGGAIYAYRNELTLRGVNIGGNIAAHYGGVVSNQGKVLMEDTYLAENRATTPGSDYDFYFMTIGNANGNGTKNSVFGKARNINLTGHGAPPLGDTNWIAEKDGVVCDNFDINSVFEGSWINDVWVGTLRRTFTPPSASPSALPEIFANFGNEDDDLLTGLDLVL